MSGDEEWGPWTINADWGCPIKAGVYCHIYATIDDPFEGTTTDYEFEGILLSEHISSIVHVDGILKRHGGSHVVKQYRIRKPRSLTRLQEIARNPERELEDA